MPSGNPLLSLLKVQADGLPRNAEIPYFAEIKGDHVEAAIQKYLDEMEEKVQALEAASSTVTLRELIDRLDDLDDTLDIQWGAVKHLNSVKTNDELRAAIDVIEPKMTAMGLRVSQSKPIFEALERVQPDATTDAEKRVIELAIRSRKLSGIALEGDAAARFNELALEMSSLKTKFGNTTVDATKKWTKLITSKEDLKGVPDSYLEGMAEKAKKEGHESATADEGPWMLGVDLNAYLPIIQYAKNRDLREEIFRARSGIAGPSYGELSNVETIKQILKLRKESAQLLGFKNHAEKSCAAKMATPEEAKALLENLLAKSYDMAVQEHKELQAYAQNHGFEGDLKHWDVAFWSEHMKKELYDFNSEELRPYFPLDQVMSGLFTLLERLFGIQVSEFEIPETAKWDDHVRMYEIKKDEKTVAYFFVDPFVRPGEKRGGAWMNEVCSRSALRNDRIPVAHVILNNTPPTETKPSLLNWREVETVFHEMGHALQHMMTQVTESGVSGIRGVEWDVVELPSQFMENWVYQYDVLTQFAKHYETGEVLPRELFDKVEKAKNYRAASFVTRQLRFGLTDFYLHSQYDVTSDKTIWDVNREIVERTTVLPPFPEDYFLCQFGHIFNGGYSAGYFSYLWAEVMSADAFAAFEDVGLDNEEGIKKMGQRFRDTVLALGGARHPADVYKLYRGHAATVDALIRHKGLLPQ